MRENRNVVRVVRVAAVAALAITMATMAACDRASSESIQKWKGTEKGPAKLEAALKDSSLAPNLRAEAAIAMTEIHLLDNVEGALATMPALERTQVVAAIVPMATNVLQNPPSPSAAGDARDLLVSARAEASADLKAGIDRTLIAATEADLAAGRRIAGRHSLQKMVTDMGSSAGPMLARALESPSASYVELADLLGRVGDEPSRERGGVALVKRAQSMRPMPPAMWKAIGTVGGPTCVQFLRTKIEKGTEAEAVEASRAIQQRREPQLLPFALTIAANPSANRGVREEMFGVIELAGGAEARQGLVKIIATDKEELVRYRAYEAALAADKAAAIVPALEAFPAGATYKPEDVQDYLVKDIQKLGAPARPGVLQALGSSQPLARVTAVMALEFVGTSEDVAALQKLRSDKAAPKGFPATRTIGKEAERVAGLLAQKAK